ncbi:MAG: phage major capsid protein [Sedimenticola sp.]
MKEQTRILEIDLSRTRDGDNSVPATISTEFPVDRGRYIEVLEHSEAAIDLSRAPLPLIESHDIDSLNIGVVEEVRVVGGKLKGRLRFGESRRAKEILRDVKAGVVRNLSIGYKWLDYLQDGETIKVTRWMPHECSLVAAPADPNAGIYRTLKRGNKMTTEVTQDINDYSEAESWHPDEEERKTRSQRRRENRDAERNQQRIDGILAIAGRHPEQIETARRFIANGNSVNEFRNIVETIAKQSSYVRSDSPISELETAINGEYSLVRALRAIADPKAQNEAGLEFEVSREMERKLGKRTNGLLVPLGALGRGMQRGVTYGGSGSNLVETEHLSGNFIDVLRARSQVMSMNVTVLSGLVGNVDIPRKTAGAEAFWFDADGTASITESTPTFDSVSLTPKTVGGLVNFSHKMLKQSAPQIEEIIRQDLADTLAKEIDIKAIAGDGTSNTPVGIINTTGIGSGTYANGGMPDYPAIVGLEGDLAVADADRGSMAYLTTPGMATTLKTKDVGTDTGQFIWTPGRERGQGIMNGYDAHYSTNVPAGYVLFGNWTDFIVANWGVLEIFADPYGSNFAKGSVSVRALMDIDFGVRHPESFTEIHEAAV